MPAADATACASRGPAPGGFVNQLESGTSSAVFTFAARTFRVSIALRTIELTAAAMSRLGVDLQTQGAIGATVYFFVVGFVLRELAQQQVQQRTGVTIEEWRASIAPYIQQQLATGRYPNLQRAISSGGDLDNDAAFEFILNFILDAVAARLPRSDAE